MQYRIGTVRVTNASNVVTGTNTKFLTNVSVGNTFKISGENVIYQVAVVNSDTQLTLSSNYAGVTASGLQYQITVDFTPNYKLAEVNAGDLDWAYHFTESTIRRLDVLFKNMSDQLAVNSGFAGVKVNVTPTNGQTLSLDYNSGSVFDVNATALAAGNTFTISVSSAPLGLVVGTVAIILGTGANIPTVTWPSGVTAPVLLASKEHWFSLATRDNGTTWRLFEGGVF